MLFKLILHEHHRFPFIGSAVTHPTPLPAPGSLTGVGGGDGLGEDAVSEGAQRAEGEHQRHRDDAVVPHSPHQGLRDRIQRTMDH